MKRTYIIFSSLLFTMLVLTGCSGLLDTVDEGIAVAYINIDANESRTVLPADNNTVSDLGNYTLKGSILGGTEQTFASNLTYTALKEKSFEISTFGNWTFTLSAEKDGVKYAGTVTHQISRGATVSLSFALVRLAQPSGTGAFELTVHLTADVISHAPAITAALYDATGSTILSEEKVLTISGTSTVYAFSSFAEGNYICKLTFYADKNHTAAVMVYPTIVSVATNLTSRGEVAVDKITNYYVVNHWQENQNDDDYTLFETEAVVANAYDRTKATAKSYDGFYDIDEIQQKSVSSSEITAINLYYARKSKYAEYKLNLGTSGYYDGEGKDGIYTLRGKIGTPVSVKDEKVWKQGPAFSHWNPALPKTFETEKNGTEYTAVYHPFYGIYDLDAVETAINGVTYTDKYTKDETGPRVEFLWDKVAWDISDEEDYTINDGTVSYTWSDSDAIGIMKITLAEEVKRTIDYTTVPFDDTRTYTLTFKSRESYDHYYMYLTYEGEIVCADKDGNTITGYGTQTYLFVSPIVIVHVQTSASILYYLGDEAEEDGAENSVFNVYDYVENGNSDITLYPASWQGHTFLGWYDNQIFTGEPWTEIPAGTRGNLTLYAKWE